MPKIGTDFLDPRFFGAASLTAHRAAQKRRVRAYRGKPRTATTCWNRSPSWLRDDELRTLCRSCNSRKGRVRSPSDRLRAAHERDDLGHGRVEVVGYVNLDRRHVKSERLKARESVFEGLIRLRKTRLPVNGQPGWDLVGSSHDALPYRSRVATAANHSDTRLLGEQRLQACPPKVVLERRLGDKRHTRANEELDNTEEDLECAAVHQITGFGGLVARREHKPFLNFIAGDRRTRDPLRHRPGENPRRWVVPGDDHEKRCGHEVGFF